MDVKKIIENQKRITSPISSGVNKSIYLNVIEKVIEGYGYKYFEDIISGREVFQICIGLRACGALSYLLSNNRKSNWYDLWTSLMDKSLEELFNVPKYRNDVAENDLAVQELMIAMKNMKTLVPKEKYNLWYEKLKRIDPYKNYHCILPNNAINNMTMYNMAGEYLRESEGMTDTSEYFDVHMPLILEMFDENGMFIDHDYPMLYDLTTRCRAYLMIWFGYEGKYFKKLNNNLEKAGLMTLVMQSSAFQLPYGGRSNQYLFNEALVASCCEFEASRYQKSGDLILAGMFKRCARQSCLTIFRWLDAMFPPKHNKNFYSHDDSFGIDGYGTYHRYLIALANFIGYGFIYANEDIEEYKCPSELGGYSIATSKKLHKIFANCRGNFIEIETAADPKYDSTGMGRYHKNSVPVELALSLPFTSNHKYNLPENLTKRNISICTGWIASDGKKQFISDFTDELKTDLEILEENIDKVIIRVTYSSEKISGCKSIIETFTLTNGGVKIESEITECKTNQIFITVPLFYTNGRDHSKIELNTQVVNVKLDEYLYLIETNGSFSEEDGFYGNRNGVYKLAIACKDSNKIILNLNMM